MREIDEVYELKQSQEENSKLAQQHERKLRKAVAARSVGSLLIGLNTAVIISSIANEASVDPMQGIGLVLGVYLYADGRRNVGKYLGQAISAHRATAVDDYRMFLHESGYQPSSDTESAAGD